MCVYGQILKLRQDEKWCPAPSGKESPLPESWYGENLCFVAAFWSLNLAELGGEREKGHGSFTRTLSYWSFMDFLQ